MNRVLRHLPKAARAILPILLFCGLLQPVSALALEKVTLQLKWTHAFQFAGYYAAKEKGYYRDAGLDVNIVEATSGIDPVQQVLSGRASFGVGTSSLVLQRAAGKPVVVLAVIFQQSPYEIYVGAHSHIHSVHDLVGKSIMLEPQADELLAYLKREGVPLAAIRQVPHSFNPQDLVDDRVDAMAGYVSTEPYYFQQANFPYQAFSPLAAGINFYGDNLFTSEKVLHSRPEMVKAFRAASLRGWQYAKDHPDEIIHLIMAKYSGGHTLSYYQFEAEKMIPLLQPDLIEMGYMNPLRWQHIANVYADLGMIPRDYSLDGFLYDAEADSKRRWMGWVVTLATLAVLTVSGIALYIYRTNRRLKVSIAENHTAQAALASRERHYRLLVENMRDVVWILDPFTQRFRYVSPSVERLRGYTAEEVMARPLKDAVIPLHAHSTLQRMQQHLQDFLDGRNVNEVYYEELEQPCKDGSTVWTEVMAKFIRDDETGQVEIQGVTRDITARKQADASLRLAATVFDTVDNAVMVCDADATIIAVNPSFTRVTGYEAEEVIGKNPRILSSGLQSREFYQHMWQELTTSGSWKGEILNCRKDGGIFVEWLAIRPVRDGNDTISHYVAAFTDITERKAMEQKMERMAHYDALTDLPNRALFSDRLQQALAQARRDNAQLALLFIDLDKFKPINDTYGHGVGDVLLKQAAGRMQSHLRNSDTVARIGGDEFVVLLRKVDTPTDALGVGQKIAHAFEEPFEINGHSLSVSVSIGAAIYPHDGTDEIELTKHADMAMYRAKGARREKVRLFSNAPVTGDKELVKA